MSQNYGTVRSDGRDHQNGSTLDHESQPLLSSSKNSRQSLSNRIGRHMGQEVDKKWTDLILLLCYSITGLLDSSAISIWGSFVSMQTGNTVYLGLGISNPSSGTRWIKSGISIACFCLGSFVFARFHRYFTPKKRWVLIASFGIQMLLIMVAIIIVTVTANDKESDLHWHATLPLALVAFQSSGQAVTSRALEQNALTSVVLTSIFCDLFSDAKLFAGLTENPDRNRRLAAPACLLAGAVFGGFWSNSGIGILGALWTAIGLKFFIVGCWFMWPATEEEDGG